MVVPLEKATNKQPRGVRHKNKVGDARLARGICACMVGELVSVSFMSIARFWIPSCPPWHRHRSYSTPSSYDFSGRFSDRRAGGDRELDASRQQNPVQTRSGMAMVHCMIGDALGRPLSKIMKNPTTTFKFNFRL